MSKNHAYYTPKSINISKRYIVTQPTSSRDLAEDFYDEGGTDAAWMEKTRRQSVRQWRQIKNQLA